MGRIKVVYLDLDGVLVDFVSAALALHGAGVDRIIPGEWHMHKWVSMFPGEFWHLIRGHDFWASLQWMADGHEILNAVLDHIDYDSLWLCSSPSDDPGSYSGKYDWVSRHMPAARRRLILSPYKAALARPDVLLIDDSDTNVNSWRTAGGPAILLPRLWNSRHREAEFACEMLRRELASHA